MEVSAQQKMYKLAYYLVTDNQFEVLHINKNQKEIWLERYRDKQSQVIRLLDHGFDWKNHLKKDIAVVFQKTKAMKRLLQGKYVHVYNIYISDFQPVDSWEQLKRPMQLNEKNPVKMNIYYLDDDNQYKELNRLYQAVDGISPEPWDNEDKHKEDVEPNYYQKQLKHYWYNKRKERENILFYGKPFFTYLLLFANIAMFILLEMNGGSTHIQNLINFGAKFNPAMMDGEWWRILSAMFLHIGILHLFMNMLALYYLGTAVEQIYGPIRFMVIYLLAGIGSGLASFAFSTHVSAGASGAIFGLFGALLFFGLQYKKIFFQTMGKGILVLVGINIIFGLSVPQIDNSAHIGGLLAGFVASAIVGLPNKKRRLVQVTGLIVYVIIIGLLFLYGVDQNSGDLSSLFPFT